MRTLIIVAALAAAALPASTQAQPPAPAPASCRIPSWITIVHGNQAVAEMSIRQSGASLTGRGGEGRNTGKLKGRVSGRDVEFSIQWSNEHRGLYTGRISQSGRLSGANSDATDMRSQTTWFVRELIRC
ncbi:hypothetical protein [Caulobacter hibisci]|uniref:Uncharacterized protein n=1 Tax=Caulobacter hibisci TaxID=2035993 RepID=A0ABS0T436_9CAUL|nr:hypothetical protein [Caulobacter hibisci]MBI1686429.1 hypothetical protein [Caulobacter hibisci]